MKQKEYPAECIRGVSNQKDLIENNTVIKASVFQFQQNRCNDDGWIEESINWNDDQQAVNFTLKQKKEDKNQFRYLAIAIIPRDKLDHIKKLFQFTNPFNYERSPIEKINPYHGNLLMRKDAIKDIKNLIKSSLALSCTDIVMREDKDN